MRMKEESLRARMEFRYRARMQTRAQDMQQNKPDIATKSERDRLIADRKNDAAVPAYNQPVPSWLVQPDHSERMRQREREHRIRHLEKRLDKADQTLQRGRGQAFERG